MRRSPARSRTAIVFVAALAAVVVAATLVHLTRGHRDRQAAERPPPWPILGAYVGAGARGVAALPAWERWSGVTAPYALDFAPAQTWPGITGAAWQLAPWRDSGRRLIYSTPLFPENGDGSLEECASGGYDGHWTTLARNLVAYRLADTIVRPGWEFNGHWYDWAATGREAAFAGCFQHLVTAMRSVSGQAFEFLWNPSVGEEEPTVERAYPGDGYVDYVGVDVYDTSWRENTYPVRHDGDDARAPAVTRATWNTVLTGDHGLRHWSRFAAGHGKPLAVPEWGLAARTDGRGGGDNAYFVEQMLAFIRDPANRVAFALYFDTDVDAGNAHRISAGDSPFPSSRGRFRQIVRS